MPVTAQSHVAQTRSTKYPMMSNEAKLITNHVTAPTQNRLKTSAAATAITRIPPSDRNHQPRTEETPDTHASVVHGSTDMGENANMPRSRTVHTEATTIVTVIQNESRWNTRLSFEPRRQPRRKPTTTGTPRTAAKPRSRVASVQLSTVDRVISIQSRAIAATTIPIGTKHPAALPATFDSRATGPRSASSPNRVATRSTRRSSSSKSI